ncbi:MAG: ATP-binding cassette domain-containing protein [Oscillospiraceae bacterium]|jgi:zinc transport system ATP-binding protein|nr:ATP-binding cassette domain-containing protein [Oscillospiraceae bacterium]
MPTPGVALQCDKLCLGYENREVLHDLSFTLHFGQRLCVVGENGSGKSTLLRALLGLKKQNHGTIVFSDKRGSRAIGYLPQQSAAQRDFPAKAREIVRSGLLNSMGLRPWYANGHKARTAETMAQMGVTDLANRCFRELSGGQQRRVLLARALCAAGGILLLDEPEAGLDPIAAQELSRRIETLHKEQNMAIIHVTHEVTEALRGASLILHLTNAPNAYFLGAPARYLEHPLSRRLLTGHTSPLTDKG